jgi:hypothetical protein
LRAICLILLGNVVLVNNILRNRTDGSLTLTNQTLLQNFKDSINWMQASSQTAMYTIAQRIQMQSGKLQMQQRECFLEDGGYNAPEQI